MAVLLRRQNDVLTECCCILAVAHFQYAGIRQSDRNIEHNPVSDLLDSYMKSTVSNCLIMVWGIDLALTNCNQWFHVDASPPSSSPWARDLLKMSVTKTVQFTYCVGYTMRGRSWNAKDGWTEREVE